MGRLLDDLNRLSAAAARGNVLAGGKEVVSGTLKVSSLSNSRTGAGARRGHVRKGDLITRHRSADFVAQHYEVIQEIGRGSFSRVELVRDRRTGHERVCKVVDTREMSAEVLALTRAEIEVLSELDHPSIIRLYEYADDTAKRRLVLILEYIAGGDCSGMLQESGGTISEARVRRLVRQLLMATSCCHAHGIVHRDIKPQNMMLTSSNDRWDAPDLKLIDFGLATKMPKSRDFVGTPAYMPPEILEGLVDYTSQADMWSIGCVVVELLTGDTPFGKPEDHGGDMEPVFEAIRQFSSFEDVSGKLEESASWMGRSEDAKDFVERLLIVDPERRMTALQAMNHPWLARSSPSLGGLTADMVKSMQQYAAAGALLRHCLYLVAVRAGVSEQARIATAFASADCDGDGSISRQELVDALARMAICGWTPTEVDPSAVFAAADLDRNGRLGFTEFAAACLFARYGRSPHRLADMSFSALDDARQGAVSPDRMRAVFTDEALREASVTVAGHMQPLSSEDWRTCVRAAHAAAFGGTTEGPTDGSAFDGGCDKYPLARFLRMFACEQLLCSGCEQFRASENDDEGVVCFSDAPSVLCHDFDPNAEAEFCDYKVPDVPARMESPYCVDVVRSSRRGGGARPV